MEPMPPSEAPTSSRVESTLSPGRFLWPLALAAGVLAGFTSWGAGEFTRENLAPSYGLTPEQAASRSLGVAEIRRQRGQSARQIVLFTYGALGGALGFALGAAGGLASRSLPRGLAGAAVGLVAGAALAAGAAKLLAPIYFERLQSAAGELTHDLYLPLLIHGGIWIPAGIAGGLALGVGLGGRASIAKGMAGGAMGAALGTLLYEFGGAMIFPTAETMHPIASQIGPRLLAHLGVAVLASAGAAWAVRSLSVKHRPQVVPPLDVAGPGATTATGSAGSQALP
jgi:hypothetical protein